MSQPVIVLIEDNAGDARWFWMKLREAGVTCDVMSFGSGEAALESLRGMAPPPDLIVADWYLPKLEGAELISELKRIRGLEPVPVIVLTGDSRRRSAALRAGAVWCLEKPLGAQGVATLLSFVRLSS
jgi:CheY-like chemotaxis protein